MRESNNPYQLGIKIPGRDTMRNIAFNVIYGFMLSLVLCHEWHAQS